MHKIQFTGTFPNLLNLLIKSVMSLMWEGSFCAKGLRRLIISLNDC